MTTAIQHVEPKIDTAPISGPSVALDELVLEMSYVELCAFLDEPVQEAEPLSTSRLPLQIRAVAKARALLLDEVKRAVETQE